MEHHEITVRAGAGILPDDLDLLVKGSVSPGVAKRLGLPAGDIEDFIRGSATPRMTKRLGLTMDSAAEELARVYGPGGVAGIILGMLFWNS
jgi:hypothetical protein